MKRIFIFLTVLLTSFSLFSQNNTFSNLVQFDKVVYDLGDILESDGTKKITFNYTNVGNQPFVIHDIISACGCTVPKWDKRPIRPGEKGTISVNFLNDQGPYPFDKALTVMISQVGNPITLRIRGIVHEKKKSLKELFPNSYDGVIGLRTETLSLDKMSQGKAKEESTSIANFSKKDLKVTFKDVTPGLTIEVSPNPIPANSKAEIKYKVDPQQNSKLEWGSTIYNATMLLNGKEASKKISVETMIRDDFSNHTKEQIDNGPLPILNKTSEDLIIEKKDETYTSTFTIKNIGKYQLLIYKAETTAKGVQIEYPEAVATNETVTIKITGKVKDLQEDDSMVIVSFITNAPKRPVFNYFVTFDRE